MSIGPLYHWSPRDRLKGIKRLGLVPGKGTPLTYENSVTGDDEEYVQQSVSFSLDPITAWNYSHGAWKTKGVFDLWQVWIDPTDEVHILPMWGGKIAEIRIHNRIPKRRVTHVGERTVT